MDALRAAVRVRRGLVVDRRVAQQRLHDQLNALCPGLSAPAGHGRSLPVASPTGLAVLACAAAFSGRPPGVRSLITRVRGLPSPGVLLICAGPQLGPPRFPVSGLAAALTALGEVPTASR